jgi:SAM-dependent methyltransferase
MSVESRFSDRVADYAKHRPSYPAEALDFLVRELALASGSVVADLGSGTGIFSALLLDRGVRVRAVEPNASMREAAERALGSREGFSSHAGKAERTGLPDASVDAIVAAQAFHWFDPPAARIECQRLLRERGAGPNVALVWNARRESGTPFLEGYERLLLDGAVDYAAVRHQSVASSGALETFFGGVPKRWSTPSVQVFDWEGLRGRAASSSYVPAADHPQHAAFFAALRELFDRTNEGGLVRFEYDVDVWYGHLAPSRSTNV